MNAEERVRRWFEEAVIGLNLCPFAAEPHRKDRVRFTVFETADFDEAISGFLDELQWLVDHPSISTTLLIYPNAFQDFDDYLDAAEVCDALLEEAGLDGTFQVATFHPDYQFENTEPDDLSNFTNRAPLPILHLLREDEISAVVVRHPDPDEIPKQNMMTMQKLGAEGLRALWDHWS